MRYLSLLHGRMPLSKRTAAHLSSPRFDFVLAPARLRSNGPFASTGADGIIVSSAKRSHGSCPPHLSCRDQPSGITSAR